MLVHDIPRLNDKPRSGLFVCLLVCMFELVFVCLSISFTGITNFKGKALGKRLFACYLFKSVSTHACCSLKPVKVNKKPKKTAIRLKIK